MRAIFYSLVYFTWACTAAILVRRFRATYSHGWQAQYALLTCVWPHALIRHSARAGTLALARSRGQRVEPQGIARNAGRRHVAGCV